MIRTCGTIQTVQCVDAPELIGVQRSAGPMFRLALLVVLASLSGITEPM
jgi:hypothetical protein